MKQDKRYAALYVRVSTDAQREEGYSIEAQQELLTAYCKAKEIKPTRLFTDGGFSGANMRRPALEQLIDEAKAGRLSAVLVYKLDRLSRSQKDTLYLIEDVFNPNGVDFISLNENMDTSTPIGRAMLGIMSAFAQLERETIKERTRMGMLERVKNGLWPGGGKPPFGYSYDRESGSLIPNDDAITVQKAYAMLLTGYAPNKIAEALGLKYEKQAAELLRRKTNIGYIVYNGIEYKGRHQPIIDEGTYYTAQKILKDRERSRAGENSHLLAGLLFCGKCGARMRYAKWGKAGYKLYCYSQQRSKPYLVHNADCDNARVWAKEVEEAVLSDILSLQIPDNEGAGTAFDEEAYLVRQRETLARKLKRLYELYAADGNKLLLSTIEENKKAYAEAEAAYARYAENKQKSSTQTEAFALINSLADAWQYMEQREKQLVLRRLIDRIIITDGDVEIYYNFLHKSQKKP